MFEGSFLFISITIAIAIIIIITFDVPTLPLPLHSFFVINKFKNNIINFSENIFNAKEKRHEYP